MEREGEMERRSPDRDREGERKIINRIAVKKNQC
jgi:hypothetical protein